MGMRWRIGDGKNINIWCDPWLRSDGSCLITSNSVAGTEEWPVSNLIDSTTHTWRQSLVSPLFNPNDVQHILNIPLPCIQSDDTPIWRLSKRGIYSVKSAYYGFMEQLIDNSHLKVSGDWPTMWKLKIPPKVKLFIWRLLRGVLPTRSRLHYRGVNCPCFCQFCEVGEENDWHVFVGCTQAMRVWEAAGYTLLPQNCVPRVADLKGLVFEMLQRSTQQQKNEIAMVLWCLWKRRNDKVRNGEELDVRMSIVLAMRTLHDWEAAKQVHSSIRSSSQAAEAIKWAKPEEGTLKCNVDAALFREQGCYGIGICVRNHRGEFLQAKVMHFHGRIPAVEAEARGLWEAISWVVELGYHNVIFETDCKFVADGILDETSYQTEASVIIRSCRSLLSLYQNYSVSFARRQTNFVAHT